MLITGLLCAAARPAAAQELGTCAVTFRSTVSAQGFVHPGVGLTEPILQNARRQIAAGAEPWTSSFKAMQRSSAAGTGVTSSNRSSADPTKPASDAFNSQGFNGRFIADGLKSYTQAILYVLTGEEVYRKNALDIIRIWEQMDPAKYKYFTDSHIHTGVPLNRMVSAAELLRYTSCADEAYPWTDADTQAFTHNLVVPVIETFQNDNNHFMNQHSYPLMGAMAGAIFMDDTALYKRSVEWFTVNATAKDQGFNGSIARLFRWVDHDDRTGKPIKNPHVQHTEMGRDQAHGGGDLTNAAIISRMLLAQGPRTPSTPRASRSSPSTVTRPWAATCPTSAAPSTRRTSWSASASAVSAPMSATPARATSGSARQGRRGPRVLAEPRRGPARPGNYFEAPGAAGAASGSTGVSLPRLSGPIIHAADGLCEIIDNGLPGLRIDDAEFW
jgi:hypothetical protein